MDWTTTFAVSGVEVCPLVPFAVGLVVSFFTSMGGVSGAFLLLPFQVSVLGFDSPAVSGTNLVFNIVAIPSGIWRFVKEGRMNWPLAGLLAFGTIPGVLIGAIVRVRWLPDPGAFRLFVGAVLLYIGSKLAWDVFKSIRAGRAGRGTRSDGATARSPGSVGAAKGASQPGAGTVKTVAISWRRMSYSYDGKEYSYNPLWVLLLVEAVGLIGGIYGIGGGAIIAPFLVTVFGLPVYTVAGAALTGTFATSVLGVAFYHLLAVHYAKMGMAVAPDWMLGGLFGLGGLIGIYLGARVQKYVPATIIKSILGAIMLFLAIKYGVEFFR